MSGDGGFINWTPEFGHQGLPQDGSIYLDGHWYRDWPEVEGGGLTWEDDDGVLVLAMLDGSHVIQVPYRGSKAPLIGDRKTFQAGFLADRESDYIALETAKSKGGPLDFCPGLWMVDSFNAVDGQTYTLTRPQAAGNVAGVTIGTHPPRFFLNGVEDADAATVENQTVTAAETGQLAVWYMPVFRVAILGYSRAIADVNDLRVSMTLAEIVGGDFG